MANKEKWEEKYTFYKNAIASKISWKDIQERYNKEKEDLKLYSDRIQEQYESNKTADNNDPKKNKDFLKRGMKDAKHRKNEMERSFRVLKEKYQNIDVIRKNMPAIEKAKANRDKFQKQLDGYNKAKEQRDAQIKKREELQAKSNELEKELNEILEMRGYCENAINNPNVPEEGKENARRKLRELDAQRSANNDAYSNNQKTLEEELAKPLIEIPEIDVQEVSAKIAKWNNVCEMLLDGKEIREVDSSISNKKSEQNESNHETENDEVLPGVEDANKEQAVETIQEPKVLPGVEDDNKEHVDGESEVLPGVNEAAQGTENAVPINRQLHANVEPEDIENGDDSSIEEEEQVEDNEEKLEGVRTLDSIRINGNTYTLKYAIGKDGSTVEYEEFEYEKAKLFSRFITKADLILHRKDYGLNFRGALRADPSIVDAIYHEFDELPTEEEQKKLEESLEQYFNFVSGKSDKCFRIEYDEKNRRHQKALEKAQERLLLEESMEADFEPVEAENESSEKVEVLKSNGDGAKFADQIKVENPSVSAPAEKDNSEALSGEQIAMDLGDEGDR